MKMVENNKTWETMIAVIDEIIQTPIKIIEDKEIVKEKCVKLSSYSYENDIATKKITESKLYEMERNGEVFGSHMFLRVKKHYDILSKLEDKDYSCQAKLLFNLHAYLGNQYFYKVDKNIIEQVFMLGKMFPDMYTDIAEPQTDRMIDAAIFFRKYDIDIKAECGSVSYTEEMGQRIFDILDKKIYIVGGRYVLERIYSEFFGEYISIFDHYNISRKLDKTRNEPVNILLNLCMKNLRRQIRISNLESKNRYIDEIFQIARAWLDIQDIQSSSGMEYSMMSIDTFPIYFFSEIIFDKMCIPRQYGKKYIMTLIKYLIQPWFNEAQKEYTLRDYRIVTEYIISLKKFGIYLDLHEMSKKTKISNYKIKLILNDISIPLKDVNRDFNALDSEVNFYTRPLIQFSKEKYFYLDYHFTGLGFYLAAYDMIKEKYPILDRKQGPNVEVMLRSEIEKKGYSFLYGDYKVKDDESDCDLIMENNRMFFFEIKKRDVANEFNKIDDVAVLEQLALGMVKAQKQCFRHEKNLIQNKEILLSHKDDKIDYVSYREKEPIYKISICLPEYSFLTSKTFCTSILEVILLGGFSTINPDRQNKMNSLNALGKDILEYVKTIYGNTPITSRDVSFYSIFCSMQQLLISLWCSSSQEEFLNIVRDWIYTMDKSLNPYYSIILSINDKGKSDSIRKSAIEMLEGSNKTAIFVG